MRETSELYQQILSSEKYWVETRLIIGPGKDPEKGYGENVLCSMCTYSDIFEEDTPVAGCCISSEIDIVMYRPEIAIPKNARLAPFVRITDGVRWSEWLQKGEFWIDTREKVEDGTKLEKIRLRGYDALLRAEQDYGSSKLGWPARDIDVVREIADACGIGVDPRTEEKLQGYMLQYPAGYSRREVLGYIAATYGGSFVMSDVGKLRLVSMFDIPRETRYLIDRAGNVITFGGDRILV